MQTPEAVPSAAPARPLNNTATNVGDATYRHVMYCAKAMRSRSGGELSTGERLTGAVANGKLHILKQMGYTLPEALNRIGASWVFVLMSDDFIREFQS